VGSTRAEGRAIGAVPRVDADLVDAAAALRWARPDLTAELADHVLEEASATDQRDRWLAAAGWAVHARAATGDGREIACGVLAALGRWGDDALAGPSAHRLRIELAIVAAGAGEVESARRLLAGVEADDGDPELTADLLCAHARCAVEDAPNEVRAALDSADAAWASVGGRAGHLGGASVALVRAVVERRGGRPVAAVDHAADGLARLERARLGSGTPSAHLAAALAAEWISALLDAGKVAEARDGCDALLPRLSERARPTRQLALLRLTVTRALAAQDPRADTDRLLAQAAEDAAACGVPDLEAVCRTTLGAMHEQAGRLDAALEALQLAVEAERRDRDRSRRFLAALAELPADPAPPKRRRARAASTRTSEPVAAAAGEPAGDSIGMDATTVLPAITRADRKLKATREAGERVARDEAALADAKPAPADERRPAEERRAGWDAVPWSSSGGESPIGDLLIQSLRSGAEEGPRNGSARRNGKPVGVPSAQPEGGEREDGEEASSGWVPSLDRTPEEPTTRRRRSADTGRRGSHRAPQDAPDTAAEATVEPAAQQERPTRSGRRARPDDDERTEAAPADAAAERPRRGRHGKPEEPADDGGGRATGGTRRRPEKPTTAEPWSPISPEPLASNGASANGYGDADRVLTAPAAGGSDDSDGWLQSALAELDRALSGIRVGGPPELTSPEPEPEPEPEPKPEPEPEVKLEPEPSDDGCVVVVDIARDGRRFAGPRASAVVHAVAALLDDRLPVGARARFGDSDVLVVSCPGWSRADATDWMHRTLPGLLDGFVSPEDLPGAQLRVAVHDEDGPVGAQILQPLTKPGRDRDPWADLSSDLAEEHGRKYRAARAGLQQDRGSRERRRSDDAATEEDGGSQRWPFSGDEGGSGRHDGQRAQSAEPTNGGGGRRRRAAAEGEKAAAEPGSGSRGRRDAPDPRAGSAAGDTGGGRAGRRAKRDDEAAATATKAPEPTTEKPSEAAGGTGSDQPREDGGGQERDQEKPQSTEGLGIADLLAGALAAYRGI